MFSVLLRQSLHGEDMLRVNWSSSSKLKFYASQQWLPGAVALVGYQAFFPARFWPMHQARSLIYSRWNGPSHSKMKAFLVPLLWLLQPGNHSQAFFPRLMHSLHQSWAEFTIKVESNLFAMAFPSLWVSSVYWKRFWVPSSDQAHKRVWEWWVWFKKCMIRRTWQHGIYSSLLWDSLVCFFHINLIDFIKIDRLEELALLIIILSYFITIYEREKVQLQRKAFTDLRLGWLQQNITKYLSEMITKFPAFILIWFISDMAHIVMGCNNSCRQIMKHADLI